MILWYSMLHEVPWGSFHNQELVWVYKSVKLSTMLTRIQVHSGTQKAPLQEQPGGNSLLHQIWSLVRRKAALLSTHFDRQALGHQNSMENWSNIIKVSCKWAALLHIKSSSLKVKHRLYLSQALGIRPTALNPQNKAVVELASATPWITEVQAKTWMDRMNRI